jgi:serine/threonine-protein kinase HipA
MKKQKNRKALVLFNDIKSGILEEIEHGYRFVYDDEFIKNCYSISVSLPKEHKVFESETLFPFFLGLLPEGWYLEIVSQAMKVDKNDKFGLLLATCKDTAGVVTIKEF